MKILGKELTFNGNKIYHAGDKPTVSEIGAAASSHTHNYAGSSSAGGAATSALTCTGNSATATKATQDSAGQQINTTYIKGLSVSGKTITYTKGDGTTGTITTQDTNTTYSTGTSSSSGLTKLYTGTGTATDGTMTQSAINTALSGKAASSHTHNYAGSSSAGGNANAAVKLATARTINGTSFDGSANITTANWGTARNIQIGNTAKSVNGSANVTWSLSEIGAAASSHTHNYAATSHNHGLLHDSFGVTIADTTTDNGWSMINGSYNGFLLKSMRSSASAPAWLQGNYSAGIAFGGADTKGVMSVAYNSPSVRFAGGNGSKPVWYFTVNGSSGKTYNMDSLAANTANTLVTARTINGTSFNGSANITTANWGTARTITIGNTGKSVNGSGNIAWSLSEIGAAAASHTHAYAPTSTGSSISIHADSDSSSTGEYLLLKAGHNELKIASSAGGTTVTKGQDKLTFNGNIVYHAGRKPTAAEIGAASTSALETVKQNISDVERNTARANHTHTNITNIASRGNVTCESGTTRPAVSGASMGQVYNNGYPTTYGNVLTLKGVGDGQLLLGWSGTDGAHAPVYVRSKRDTSTANWSGWAQVYTTAHKPTASDIGALPLSGGTMSGYIQLPNTGSSWIDGSFKGSLRGYRQSTGSYHPIITQTTSSGHKVSLGGLGDDFGFHVYDKNRTENGVDKYWRISLEGKDIFTNMRFTVQDDWLYTTGNTGWYNSTHGGGWYMSDSSWIRAYNNKNIYTAGTVQGWASRARYVKALDSSNNLDFEFDSGEGYFNVYSGSGAGIVVGRPWSGSQGTEPALYNNKGGSWGFLGNSGNAWFRVYGYGGSVSDRNKKYHITKALEEEQYENLKNINIYNYRTISAPITPSEEIAESHLTHSGFKDESGNYISSAITVEGIEYKELSEDLSQDEIKQLRIEEILEKNPNFSQVTKRQDLMLGAMVDELPTEVTFYDNEGGDGKAVDIYSYTTMIAGAVKHLIKKFEQLEKENEELKYKLENQEV